MSPDEIAVGTTTINFNIPGPPEKETKETVVPAYERGGPSHHDGVNTNLPAGAACLGDTGPDATYPNSYKIPLIFYGGGGFGVGLAGAVVYPVKYSLRLGTGIDESELRGCTLGPTGNPGAPSRVHVHTSTSGK